VAAAEAVAGISDESCTVPATAAAVDDAARYVSMLVLHIHS